MYVCMYYVRICTRHGNNTTAAKHIYNNSTVQRCMHTCVHTYTNTHNLQFISKNMVDKGVLVHRLRGYSLVPVHYIGRVNCRGENEFWWVKRLWINRYSLYIHTHIRIYPHTHTHTHTCMHSDFTSTWSTQLYNRPCVHTYTQHAMYIHTVYCTSILTKYTYTQTKHIQACVC